LESWTVCKEEEGDKEYILGDVVLRFEVKTFWSELLNCGVMVEWLNRQALFVME
jgi:hypothetical protein